MAKCHWAKKIETKFENLKKKFDYCVLYAFWSLRTSSLLFLKSLLRYTSNYFRFTIHALSWSCNKALDSNRTLDEDLFDWNSLTVQTSIIHSWLIGKEADGSAAHFRYRMSRSITFFLSLRVLHFLVLDEWTLCWMFRSNVFIFQLGGDNKVL